MLHGYTVYMTCFAAKLVLDITFAMICVFSCTDQWLTACNYTTDPCQNNGFTGANCSCVCPRGTSGADCSQVSEGYYGNIHKII